MPRLPVVLATQGIAAPEGPRIPYSAGANALGAVAQLGHTLTNVATDIADLERRKKQVAINQEVSLLQSDAELAIGTGDAQLRLLSRDPDAYLKDYETLVQQSVDDVRQRATYPESGALLSQRLAPALARHRVEAAKYSNQLYKDRSVAGLDATLDSRKTLGALSADDAEFARNYQEGLGAIHAATPIIGADKAGDMARKFKQDILGARALKEANDNPEAFYDSVYERFVAAGLDGKHAEELRQHAKTQAEANRKNYAAEWEKFYIRVEKEAEEERKAQLTGLEAKALKGQLTVKELDDAKAMRIVASREEYAALYKAATDVDRRSDEATLLDVSPRAHSAIPKVSPSELDTLYRLGKLNRQDWKELKDKVIARQDHLTNKGETELTRRHNQAEQIISRALGISSLYDKIDEEDKQLNDIALRGLTARSSLFDGNEDPLEVATDIVNKMAPIRQERLKLSIKKLGETLMFKAPDAASAMQKLNEKRATLPPAVVANEERKIADMTRAEGALFDANAKKLETGGQGQSGVRTGGRKPGEKPKTAPVE